MSQLSKQLRVLQLSPGGAATNERTLASGSTSGASFLFSKTNARSYSREQILALATEGLRTLLQIDNRFHRFLSILFDQDKTRQERGLLRESENQHLHEAIDAFLTLLSPHLFLTASHQVLEYLIRVHEVHVFHPTSLIRAFLPYHDHNLFSRVLLVLDLRDTGFDFLMKNQERGAPLLREDLILACTQSRKVLQLVCECMILPMRMGVYHGAANALFAAVASRLAVCPMHATSARPEGMWRQMLPYILECLTTPAAGLRHSSSMAVTGLMRGEDMMMEQQLGLLQETDGEVGVSNSEGRSTAEARARGGAGEGGSGGSVHHHSTATSVREYRASGQEIPIHHREAVCTVLLVIAAWSTEVQFSVPVMLTLLKPVLAYTREQSILTAGWFGQSRDELAAKRKQTQREGERNRDLTSVYFTGKEEEEDELLDGSSQRRGQKEVIVMPLENWLLFLDFLFKTQNALHERHSQSAFAGVFRVLLQVPWKKVVAMNPVYAQLHLRQCQAAEEEVFFSSLSTSSMRLRSGEGGKNEEAQGGLKEDDFNSDLFTSKTENAIPLAALLSSLMHFSLERIRVCCHLSSLSTDVRLFLETATSTLPLPLRLVKKVLMTCLRTHGKILVGEGEETSTGQVTTTTVGCGHLPTDGSGLYHSRDEALAKENNINNNSNEEEQHTVKGKRTNKSGRGNTSNSKKTVEVSDDDDVKEEKREAFSFFQSILEALEHRYPRIFDKCLCLALEDPQLRPIATFALSHHLSGTRYQLVQLPTSSFSTTNSSSTSLQGCLSHEPLPLFACFIHPSPEVRRLGAEAVQHQLSLSELLSSSVTGGAPSSGEITARGTRSSISSAKINYNEHHNGNENSLLDLLTHAMSFESDPTVAMVFLQSCARPLQELVRHLLRLPSSSIKQEGGDGRAEKVGNNYPAVTGGDKDNEEEEERAAVARAATVRGGNAIEEEEEDIGTRMISSSAMWRFVRVVLRAARQVTVLHSGYGIAGSSSSSSSATPQGKEDVEDGEIKVKAHPPNHPPHSTSSIKDSCLSVAQAYWNHILRPLLPQTGKNIKERENTSACEAAASSPSLAASNKGDKKGKKKEMKKDNKGETTPEVKEPETVLELESSQEYRLLHSEVLYATVLLYDIVKRREAAWGSSSSSSTPSLSTAILSGLIQYIPELQTTSTPLSSSLKASSLSSPSALHPSSASASSSRKSSLLSRSLPHEDILLLLRQAFPSMSCDMPDIDLLLRCPSLLVQLYEMSAQRLPELLRLTTRLLRQQQEEDEEEAREVGRKGRLTPVALLPSSLSSQTEKHMQMMNGTSPQNREKTNVPERTPTHSGTGSFLRSVYQECVLAVTCCLYVELYQGSASRISSSSSSSPLPHCTGRAVRLLHYFLLGPRLGEMMIVDATTTANAAGVPLKQGRQGEDHGSVRGSHREDGKRENEEGSAEEEEARIKRMGSSSSTSATVRMNEEEEEEEGSGYLFALQQLQREAIRSAQQQQQRLSPSSGPRGKQSLDVNKIGRGEPNSILARAGYLPRNSFTKLLARAVYGALTLGLCVSPLTLRMEDTEECSSPTTTVILKEGEGLREGRVCHSTSFSLFHTAATTDAATLHLMVLLLPLLGAPLPPLSLAPHQLPYAYSRLLCSEWMPWAEGEGSPTTTASLLSSGSSPSEALVGLIAVKKYFEVPFFSLVRDAVYKNETHGDKVSTEELVRGGGEGFTADDVLSSFPSTLTSSSLKASKQPGWWGALGLMFILPLCIPAADRHTREREVVRLQEAILHAVSSCRRSGGASSSCETPKRRKSVTSCGSLPTEAANTSKMPTQVVVTSPFSSPAEMVFIEAMRGLCIPGATSSSSPSLYCCSVTALHSIAESLAKESSRFSVTPEAAIILARCLVATWGGEEKEGEMNVSLASASSDNGKACTAPYDGSFTFMIPRRLAADAIEYFFPITNPISPLSSSSSIPLLRLPLDIFYPSMEQLMESIEYQMSTTGRSRRSKTQGRIGVSVEVARYFEVISARGFITSFSSSSSTTTPPPLPTGALLAIQLLRYPVLDTIATSGSHRLMGETTNLSRPFSSGATTMAGPAHSPPPSHATTRGGSVALYPYALSLLSHVFQHGIEEADRADYEGVTAAQGRRSAASCPPLIFRAGSTNTNNKASSSSPSSGGADANPSSSRGGAIALPEKEVQAIVLATRPLLFSAMRRMGSGASEVGRFCVQTIGGYHRVLLPLLAALDHHYSQNSAMSMRTELDDSGRTRKHSTSDTRLRTGGEGAEKKIKAESREEGRGSFTKHNGGEDDDEDLQEMSASELWEILVELLSFLVPPPEKEETEEGNGNLAAVVVCRGGNTPHPYGHDDTNLSKRWMESIRSGTLWAPPPDYLILRPLTFTQADAMLALCAKCLSSHRVASRPQQGGENAEAAEEEELASSRKQDDTTSASPSPFLSATPSFSPSVGTEWVLRVLSLILRIAPSIRVSEMEKDSDRDSHDDEEEEGENKKRRTRDGDGASGALTTNRKYRNISTLQQRHYYSLYDFLHDAFLARFPFLSFMPLLLLSSSAAESSVPPHSLSTTSGRDASLQIPVAQEEGEDEEVAITSSSFSTGDKHKSSSLTSAGEAGWISGGTVLSKAVSFLSVPAIGFSRFTIPVLHVWETLISLALHNNNPTTTTTPMRHAMRRECSTDVLLRADLVKEGLRMMTALLSPSEGRNTVSGEEEEEKQVERDDTVWTERRIALLTAIFQTLSPLLARSSSSSSTMLGDKKPGKMMNYFHAKGRMESERNDSDPHSGRGMFALHIPLVALLIRLQHLDHAATLGFQSAVDFCRTILTSFNGTTQILCVSALMELLMQPEESLKYFYHPLYNLKQHQHGGEVVQNHNGAADAVEREENRMEDFEIAKVFRKVVKPNQIINRQDSILELIHTTVKSDSFLSKFIEIQFFHSSSSEQEHQKGLPDRRQGKKNKHKNKSGSEKEKEENNDEEDEDEKEREGYGGEEEEGVAACTALLTSSLSLFSHYSELNAATPFPYWPELKKTTRQHSHHRKATSSTLDREGGSRVEDEEEDQEKERQAALETMMEAKSYVHLLERLAGNTLGCVLAGIHENTFVQCLHTLLADNRTSIQQKGLEVLLDRLHHSLPTSVDENAGGAAGEDEEVEAYRKALRDPKQKIGLTEFIRIRARPRTTKRSFSLLPLLDGIVDSTLSRLTVTTLLSSSSFSTQSLHGGGEKMKNKNVGLAEEEEEAGMGRELEKGDVTRILLSVSCMEELIRLVASGGSLQAERTLLNVHRSKSVSVATLVKLLGNKKRLEEVRKAFHAMCKVWIPTVQQALQAHWNALQKLLREGRPQELLHQAPSSLTRKVEEVEEEKEEEEIAQERRTRKHTGRVGNGRGGDVVLEENRAKQAAASVAGGEGASFAQQVQALQENVQWYVHCLTGLFTFLGTCGQVLGAGFMAPHCQEVLEVVMSVALDQVFAAHRFPPPTLSSLLSFTDKEQPQPQEEGEGSRGRNKNFSASRGEDKRQERENEEEEEAAASRWSEAHRLCRFSVLTAFLRTFPSCWHMCEPFLPGLLLVASHARNVEDPRTQPLCQEIFAVLDAVLEPSIVLRAAAECVWGWDPSRFQTTAVLSSTGASDSSTSSVSVLSTASLPPHKSSTTSLQRSGAIARRKTPLLHLSPATHSIPVFFQNGVHRLVERLSREDILHLRFLCDGSTVQENFWAASLDMLARSPVLPPSDILVAVLDAFYTFFIKFKSKNCNVYLTQLGLWAFGESSTSSSSPFVPTSIGERGQKEKRQGEEEGTLEKGRKDRLSLSNPSFSDASTSSSSPSFGGTLSRSILHRWTLYYSLYNFLLIKMGSIMDFSFGVVMPYVTQHLHRFSVEVSGVSSSSSSLGVAEERTMENQNSEEEEEEDGSPSSHRVGRHRRTCHRHSSGSASVKALTSRLTVFLLEVLQTLRRICTSCTPGPHYDYSVPPEVYVAHPDVFKAVMPVLVRQVSNFEWFKRNQLQHLEDDVEHSVLHTIRAFFMAVGCNAESGNKLQARTQGELLRLLRHPHAVVRRLTLRVLDGVYEDGGEELAARLMAEMLPSVVEMTEDRDELVVEEARLLCSHLSTIAGQDVLHAMS